MNDVTEFIDRQAYSVQFIYRCPPNDVIISLVFRLHTDETRILMTLISTYVV